MSVRIKEVTWKVGALLCIGLLYAFVYQNTDFHIPCIFYKTTGWLCPGCGVSAMCISLLHLDFSAAFHYNPGIFIGLPFLLWITVSVIWKYIQTGETRLRPWQRKWTWVLLVYFLSFGIVRNLQIF